MPLFFLARHPKIKISQASSSGVRVCLSCLESSHSIIACQICKFDIPGQVNIQKTMENHRFIAG
jgi:hypothetical protein